MDSSGFLISQATQRNWEKLGVGNAPRLASRANKSNSKKRFTPDNYVDIEGLSAFAESLTLTGHSTFDIIFELCRRRLNCLAKSSGNVARFFSEYTCSKPISIEVPEHILNVSPVYDWIGYVYQALVAEGNRNLGGVYYTNYKIVRKMLSGLDITGKTFFDPCCGGGAFLLNLNASSLSQIYGMDSDEIAVMIAKANLICRYPADCTYPNIYCGDFLADSNILSQNPVDGQIFDYIYTNPPWGVCKTNRYQSNIISSGERASLFLVKAFAKLRVGGVLNFLLPSSLIKVGIHKDIRKYILQNTCIRHITLYNERFNGVFTDFFSIKLANAAAPERQNYTVQSGEESLSVACEINEDYAISLNSEYDSLIIRQIENLKNDDLSHSTWALGIVTGNNAEKIKKAPFTGSEIIYTGKDISRYKLRSASNHILYDRAKLQQCARDAIYRSSEKLVYKFISKSLYFAYDNTGSLFLNSANILIPDIDGMSIKTVLAFLNSELFSFYYSKKFSDIKVLRGNLERLPFPKISEKDNTELTQMTDRVLANDPTASDDINSYIYQLFHIDKKTIEYIKKSFHGNPYSRT